ncbi:MAG TPA: hypothetical protein VFW83_06890 [Bryobacteraceae bacterium]|nr:hypothetical protein [Bryobacteraceae bacterium]
MKGHLTADEFIERLYGAGNPEGESHLRECPRCAGRLAALERRRAEAAGLPPISNEFLASQRRVIYERVERPSHGRVSWAPAVVAAFLMAVGVYFYYPDQPAPDSTAPAAAPAAINVAPRPALSAGDAQLFSDVYSMEETAEPSAAAPIHALFELQDGPQ